MLPAANVGVGCAAGALCGRPTEPFQQYHFNCMNCQLPMHGPECGASWSEKSGKYDCTKVNVSRLTAHGKEQQSKGGMWICAQCITTCTSTRR